MRKVGIDIISMLDTYKEQDKERSFGTENVKPDQQIPSIESRRHSSNSPATSRRKKITNTLSLHDVPDTDKLLQSNEINVNTSRTKSAPDLGMGLLSDDMELEPLETTADVRDVHKTEKEDKPSQVGRFFFRF